MDSSCKVKVSVLVAVYNVERFLPRCLDSLIAQTLRDIEIVCVNDASPDRSAAILADYAARDPRIRIITKTANEGLMMARKTGYTDARGEYLCFCDSDDYMPADALESLYSEALSSGADITVGEMYLENNAHRHVLRPRHHVASPGSEPYLRAILNWTTCSLCGSLFKRSLFAGKSYHTMANQSFSEDRMLLTQILTAKEVSVATICKPTYFYCLNNSSITRKKLTDNALKEQLKALFWCYEYVEAHAPGLQRDNRNFIIRYLSLYIERGASRQIIKQFNPMVPKLLEFNAITQTCSLRFALHTRMCLHSRIYRACCSHARNIIRRIQGKD